MGENKSLSYLSEDQISLEKEKEDGKIIEGTVDGIAYKIKRIGNGAYNYSIDECELEQRIIISKQIEGTVKKILSEQREKQKQHKSLENIKDFFDNLANGYKILGENIYELDHDKICELYYSASKLVLGDQRPESPDILETKKEMDYIFKNKINSGKEEDYYDFVKAVENFEKAVNNEVNENSEITGIDMKFIPKALANEIYNAEKKV